MSFNTALSVTQKNKLRSASYAGDLQLTLCSNTVVFAGQVNSDLTTPTSWAQFNYNNVTVGAYTDVELDEVILIGTANDITKATYRGRIRKAPTSSIIYTSESSMDFVAGAYFWVIYTFDPTYKLSRPSTNDPATASELVDYDLTYAAPRACSVGLRTAYVGRVDATNKMRVAFDVSSSYAVASGDSISSYLFTFVASTYTVVSGSLSTAIVTVDFNADTEQWGKLTITTANGQVKTRRFYVRAYGTNSQPDTGADETSLQISGDLARGYTLSATYFTGINSVLNRTFGVAWREKENYGGTAGALDSTNNIAFVGWLQREDDTLRADGQFAVLSDARFEFTGVGPRMQRLRAQEVAIRINSSPSEWGDIVNLTPWRAIAHFLDRYSTITNLCDLNFSDKTTAYLFPDFGTQGENLYAAVQGIARQIEANIEFAPDGRIEVNISAEYLTNLGRAGLVTVLDIQAQDCFNIVRSTDPDGSVGVVDGVGASYNSSSGQVSTYAALAPGHAQGEAPGSDTLQGPVLVATGFASAALIDLKQRAGNRLEVVNNNEVLDMDHPDGFTFGVPSRYQLYTLTIDTTVAGSNGVSRIVYDTTTFWLLEAVSYGRPGNGATNVHHRYRRLSRIGDPGDDVTQVAANQLEDQLPDLGFPAFNFDLPELTIPDDGLASVNPAQLEPPKGMIVATNGETIVAATPTQIFLERNFITLTRPRTTDVTPSDLGSFQVQSIAVDPYITATDITARFVGSDTADSAAWVVSNIASPTAASEWTKGAEIAGIYNVLRAVNEVNGLLAYAPGGDTALSYDFIASDGGWTLHLGSSQYGVYVGGSGWHDNFIGGVQDGILIVSPSFSSRLVTELVIEFSTAWTGTSPLIRVADAGFTTTYASTTASGSTVIHVAGVNQTLTQLSFNADPYNGDIQAFAGYITRVTILSGAANVRHTNDNGATWGSALTLSTSPGAVGGFDAQRSGDNSFGASAGAVYRATSIGGAYSSWYSITGGREAVCIVIPYFTWAGTRQTAATNPDIVVALNGLDGSSRSLLWIEGGASPGTVHDLTPVAGMTFDNANCVTVAYNHHIAVFGLVGGVYKLYTSTNQGSSWTNRGTLTSPQFLRTRRNDTRAKTSGTNSGQLYLASNSTMAYSSKWAGGSGSIANLYPRTQPASPITTFDTVY